MTPPHPATAREIGDALAFAVVVALVYLAASGAAWLVKRILK